ncbi:MAG TPA: metallophosphoesterase [Micromonosporaceae bacterium]|nr:metallophosphoesterase [Micromonosporaceae bacterium]
MRRHLLTTAILASAVATSLLPGGAAHASPEGRAHAARPVTFALLGDTPYGDAQRAVFPALVDDINAEPGVRFVLHAGDVKSGSSTCDDARFADLAALLDTFHDPLVLTPGDNEWTDCHRTAAGGFLPTERLAAVREVFYPRPGWTLGQQPMRVLTQARDPRHRAYLENTLFVRGGVVFAAVHVVGSENDLDPWAQLPGGDLPAVRLAEFEARQAAALDWIDTAFAVARRSGAPGVLLLMQAEPLDTPGFAHIRARIAASARAYDRPVLLVHGDEHVYEVEPGYAGVPNLTRLETFGDTATQWLRVTANPRAAEVFSWEPQTVPVG